MQDFARLQLAEINQAILKRRNRIFLLMEEVRRLRVQQRVKVCPCRQSSSSSITLQPYSCPHTAHSNTCRKATIMQHSR